MPSENVCNVFKHKNARSDSFNGINKNWKSVTGIVNAHLVAETAEGLAGRPTDYDVYLIDFRIFKTHFKKLVIAVTLQVPVVRFDSSFHHFIAYGTESCCLEP